MALATVLVQKPPRVSPSERNVTKSRSSETISTWGRLDDEGSDATVIVIALSEEPLARLSRSNVS
jgi:hypothetical protein